VNVVAAAKPAQQAAATTGSTSTATPPPARVPSASNAPQYEVAECPFSDLSGVYEAVAGGAFAHTGNTALKLHRDVLPSGGKGAWLLTADGEARCRNQADFTVPPQEGWEYYRANTASYKPFSRMSVRPANAAAVSATAAAAAGAAKAAQEAASVAPKPAKPGTTGERMEVNVNPTDWIMCHVIAYLIDPAAQSDAKVPPTTNVDSLCADLLRQITLAPRRAVLLHQRAALELQLHTAMRATTEDFVLIGTLGTQLQELQKESAQLPLSEEDYLTLADRHAALVEQLTEKCRELKDAMEFAALKATAESLAALKAADVSELPLDNECEVLSCGVSTCIVTEAHFLYTRR
jgi:hypothetical protein